MDAFSQKFKMLRLRTRRRDDVHGKLKRYLCIRSNPIEHGNWHGKSFKVQIADRILKLFQERFDRRFVYMRLTGFCCAALDFLIVCQFEIIRDVCDRRNSIVEKSKSFFAAAIQGRHSIFRQKAPAVIVQRAHIRVATMRPDLNVWAYPVPDRAEHFVQFGFDPPTQTRNLIGDIFQNEKLVWINYAIFDETGVDVREYTTPDFQTRAGQHERLKCNIVQVDVLQFGRRFDFDQVPRIVTYWIEDVCTGKTAVESECSFVQRAALLQCSFRLAENSIEIVYIAADFDAAGKEFFCQLADFMTLIENRLRLCVRFRDQMFGVVYIPKELRALQSRQKF